MTKDSYSVDAKVHSGFDLPSWYTDKPRTYEQALALVAKLREWCADPTILTIVIREA